MKLIYSLVLLIVPLVGMSQAAEVQKVKNDFEAYRSASLKEQGEKAIEYLDGRVFAYYDSMLMHVRHSDSTTVAELPITDQILVLAIRHRATQEQIQAFTDSTCIVFALNEGMIDKDGVARLDLGEIEITDDFAQASVSSQGEVAPIKFHFYKSDGIWKFDLTQLFPMANLVFEQIFKESGMETNELLFLLLEIASGNKIDEKTIWQPVIK